jgi:Ala-tRNA(Pro) deacylase
MFQIRKTALPLAGAANIEVMTNAAPEHAAPDAPLPTEPEGLYARLREIGVAFEVHEHPPIFTVAEGEHLKARIPGVHCRNLFVRDKKERMFLIVLANETRVDMKTLPALLGCDRLSFGSPERLWQYLGVRPGSVCPFAIINDTRNEVEIILDAGMMRAERVNYHPLRNHLTIGLSPQGLLQFIDSCGHVPRMIDFGS